MFRKKMKVFYTDSKYKFLYVMFGNLWKWDYFFFLCLSPQEELPFIGKFILIKLYNYSYANCFLLHMCHSSMAQISNTGQLPKNPVVSLLILITGFWRPLCVIIGNVYFSLFRRPLGYFPSVSH